MKNFFVFVSVMMFGFIGTLYAIPIDISNSTYAIENATTFTLHNVSAMHSTYYGTWTWDANKNQWKLVKYGKEPQECPNAVQEIIVDLPVPLDISNSTCTIENATTFTLHNVSAMGSNYYGTWTWDSVKNLWKLVEYGEETKECHNPVQESTINSPGTTGWPHTLANLCTANYDGTIEGLGVDRWNAAGLNWDVYLWDISCNQIAHVSVSGGTDWYFEDITPWPVSAGQKFYVGYVVSGGAGSYLYRDTLSPVNVGYYTVDYANYYPGGYGCPVYANGAVVTPVDVKFCVNVDGQTPFKPYYKASDENLAGSAESDLE